MDAFFSGNRIEGHRLEHGSCAFDGNCHSSSAARSQDHDLDLELPNAWSRLQGRRSFHAPCSDFLLLDPERPEASFFYMKLAGTQGACGDPMPGGELVSQDELDCVAAWILSNVPEPERGFGGAVEVPEGPSRCELLLANAPLCSLPDFDPPAFFRDTCAASTCHSATEAAQSGWGDYESPRLFERLAQSRSRHETCSDLSIIDTEEPARSMLLIKMAGSQGPCGAPMPGGALVPGNQLACVAAWIAEESCRTGPIPSQSPPPVQDVAPTCENTIQRLNRGPDPRIASRAESACMGVEEPICTSCHRRVRPRPGWWADPIRSVEGLPGFGPGHGDAYCDLPTNLICDRTEADALGLSRAQCAECHQVLEPELGAFIRRPWWIEGSLPAHPAHEGFD
ncbi:MAG: hypothetical protein AAF938_19880 [Myxococcota bacterium]